MDAVATAANVSKATVYAHYGSKQALFGATVAHECARAAARMTIAENLARHRSLEQALTDIGRAFLDTLMSPQVVGLSRMVVAESRRFPELGRIYYQSAPAHTLDDLAAYLEKAQEQGLVGACDARCAADQFLGMVRGDRLIRILLGQMPTWAECEPAIAAAVQTFVARYAAVVEGAHD